MLPAPHAVLRFVGASLGLKYLLLVADIKLDLFVTKAGTQRSNA